MHRSSSPPAPQPVELSLESRDQGEVRRDHQVLAVTEDGPAGPVEAAVDEPGGVEDGELVVHEAGLLLAEDGHAAVPKAGHLARLTAGNWKAF